MTDEITLTRERIQAKIDQMINAQQEALNAGIHTTIDEPLAIYNLALKSFDAPPVTTEAVERLVLDATIYTNGCGLSHNGEALPCFHEVFEGKLDPYGKLLRSKPEDCTCLQSVRAVLFALSEAGCLK